MLCQVQSALSGLRGPLGQVPGGLHSLPFHFCKTWGASALWVSSTGGEVICTNRFPGEVENHYGLVLQQQVCLLSLSELNHSLQARCPSPRQAGLTWGTAPGCLITCLLPLVRSFPVCSPQSRVSALTANLSQCFLAKSPLVLPRS